MATVTSSDQPLDTPEAPSGPQTQTAVLERTDTSADPRLSEPGDHERFAHFVRKEKILESAMTGNPVIALCGKVWVPGRDPEKFPVCPMCKEIYDGLRDPQDGGGGKDSGGAGD
ncbi:MULTISPECIES: DUF3039 domain-containing protein [Ornithinimicrobium]|jgi:hypothetical protein|uniref:DUF3039 domain-containing protein n=1 Tax=Ornithinimicrobium kibberense TaxID=282060 RepID=A0ABV5UZ32_9MICO|nr:MULTISPECIES: DUF3039 domain-containing protein [Ornithinimicrobium]OLT21038.1 hypothetical protein BJF81_04190 [Ornithinimicrobium sp. CNJ-824]